MACWPWPPAGGVFRAVRKPGMKVGSVGVRIMLGSSGEVAELLSRTGRGRRSRGAGARRDCREEGDWTRSWTGPLRFYDDALAQVAVYNQT